MPDQRIAELPAPTERRHDLSHDLAGTILFFPLDWPQGAEPWQFRRLRGSLV